MSSLHPTILIALLVLYAGQLHAPARAADFAECRHFGAANPERIVTACTEAITSGTLGPTDLAAAHANRGVGFRDLQQDDRAFEDFARAIVLDPLCLAAYHQRGLLHLDRGETEWAREDFDVATRIERNNADTRVEDF